MREIDRIPLDNKAVLIKGARAFHLEHVFEKLSRQSHSATLQIDLSAIGHNLSTYQSYLKDGVEVMPIIKASAYGTGGVDMARFLEQRGVRFLGVAFPDEGITLRKGGINATIVILNPDMVRIKDYVHHRLDIVTYSKAQLDKILAFLDRNPEDTLRIHLEVDSGMHRLGFYEEDLKEVKQIIDEHQRIDLVSIFSHLAGSENEEEDDYSTRQFDHFDKMCKNLPKAKYKHILNTAGIVRFPDYQYNMVRLGLGLYGIDTSHSMQEKLIKAHTLSASIIQIKRLKKGEKAGYNQSFTALEDCTIGIVNIGYADGLMRVSGNGKYAFSFKGIPLPIVGNICMDLTLCLIPENAKVTVGDEVVIFGPDHPIEKLAKASQTIPYEILSRIAPRVKRKYVFE